MGTVSPDLATATARSTATVLTSWSDLRVTSHPRIPIGQTRRRTGAGVENGEVHNRSTAPCCFGRQEASEETRREVGVGGSRDSEALLMCRHQETPEDTI